MEKKKKPNDKDRIINLADRRISSSADDICAGLTDFIDGIADASVDASDLLEDMKETVEEAVTDAGLSFNSFKLNEDAATCFVAWMFGQMFGRTDVFAQDNGPDDSQSEQLDIDELPILMWEKESKIGTRYEAIVAVDEDTDDPQDYSTCSVCLAKEHDGLAWEYDFEDHTWIVAEED